MPATITLLVTFNRDLQQENKMASEISVQLKNSCVNVTESPDVTKSPDATHLGTEQHNVEKINEIGEAGTQPAPRQHKTRLASRTADASEDHPMESPMA